MNPESDSLLNAVLGETASTEFRASLLEQTLREVRHRRRTRRFKQSCTLAAALIGFPLLFWRFSLQPAPETESIVPAFVTIRSQPLPASMIVETVPGTAPTVFSSTKTVAMIETDPTQQLFNELDDQGLLALIGDRPVILVRHGPHDAELLFVNSADRTGWPLK